MYMIRRHVWASLSIQSPVYGVNKQWNLSLADHEHSAASHSTTVFQWSDKHVNEISQLSVARIVSSTCVQYDVSTSYCTHVEDVRIQPSPPMTTTWMPALSSARGLTTLTQCSVRRRRKSFIFSALKTHWVLTRCVVDGHCIVVQNALLRQLYTSFQLNIALD